MQRLAGATLAVLLANVLIEPAAAKDGRVMPAAAVERLFPGKFEAQVAGYSILFTARSDGSLKGIAPGFSDTGRWRISGHKLCIMLRNWLKGRTYCAPVTRKGQWYITRNVVFKKR